MAIYRNGELSAKKEDTNLNDVLLSDEKLNRSIEDYIVTASKAVALLEAIAKISCNYELDANARTSAIRDITLDYRDK